MRFRWFLVPLIVFDLLTAALGPQYDRTPTTLSLPGVALGAAGLLTCSFILFRATSWWGKAAAGALLLLGIVLTAVAALAWSPIPRVT